MHTNTQLVNAWILLDEDEPAGTNYTNSNSCYQTLIQNNIYQSVDILYICFVTTTPTSAHTIPAGDGSSYTIEIGVASHPEGLTNQDYMHNVIRDARENNPNIKIAVTLNWGTGNLLSNIFSNAKYTPQQNANNFAANLMAYLKSYNLDGFDIDWESPISNQTTQNQFALLFNAIGAQFKQQTDKHYYLTLSPAEVGNLDATAVNNNMDFVNLQLYGGASPSNFVNAGVKPDLFAYGAKFEADGPVTNPQAMGHQTAQQAYQDNKENYHYSIFTNWRLNSQNYEFEQTQQQLLYQLVVFPKLAWTGTDFRLNVATVTLSNGLCKQVTISETSHLAPALAVLHSQVFMAWTGTDNALNVLASSDSTTWDTRKTVTISRTSAHCPALAVFHNALYLAWTGTDGQLNLLSSSDGKTWNNKVIIPDQHSPAAPTLAVSPNALYLGWQGTDNRLNVLASRDGRIWDPTKKITIPNELTSMAPVLVVFTNVLYLCWVGSGNNWINFLSSSDGMTFGNKYTLPNETTFATPALAVCNNQMYLAWTGTNTALNVLSGPDVTSLGNKATESETSQVGPAILGFSSA